MKREEPVDAGGRTHGIRHQADARFGHQRWPERQLCEVQLTSVCGRADSHSDDCFPAARTGTPDPERTPMAPGMQLESSRSTTEFSGTIGRPLIHWVGFNQLVRRCLATIHESGIGLLDADSHLIYSTTCQPARVESRPPEPKAIQPEPPSLQPVP